MYLDGIVDRGVRFSFEWETTTKFETGVPFKS